MNVTDSKPIVNQRIPTELKTADFYYDLPEELIAQHPAARRDGSRLMVLDRQQESIEHKHFEPENQAGYNAPYTFVSYEYPADWKRGDEPYYPVNDQHNGELYRKYANLAKKETNVIFGGRLGMYRYYDMDDTVIAARECFKHQENL